MQHIQAIALMHGLVQVDRDGNGMLTPETIALFLDDLGLNPTGHEVRLIMRELDPRQEGFVTREDFMQFIRNGGRRKLPALAPSLEKRLSIELDADKLEAAVEGASLSLLHSLINRVSDLVQAA